MIHYSQAKSASSIPFGAGWMHLLSAGAGGEAFSSNPLGANQKK